MGHASINVTYDLHGHLMPGSEDEAARAQRSSRFADNRWANPPSAPIGFDRHYRAPIAVRRWRVMPDPPPRPHWVPALREHNDRGDGAQPDPRLEFAGRLACHRRATAEFTR
jgi:hypothetical protein